MRRDAAMGRLALLLALGAGAFLLAGPAGAAQKTVVEELLDILLEEGRIDQTKYEDLLERHRREREAATSPLPAVSSEAENPEGWGLSWKNGFRVERNDGYHKLKFGGRIYNDWAVIKQGDGLDNKGSNSNWITGTEFRRARIFTAGTLFRRLIFKAEYDFADGDPEFKDVYIGLKSLGPVDSVRVGNFKEPFSLEELTSSKHITFLERALPTIFNPVRNTGLGVTTTAHEGRMSWAFGGFRETDDFGRDFGNKDNYNITTRLTGLPVYRDEGSRLVHVGLSYSHQFRENDTIDFQQRPEMHMADKLLDTGDITQVRGVDLFGPELALVHGPFSVQSELIGALIDRNQGQSDLWLWGVYAEAGYWITGEHRPYKQSIGVFDRVSPRENFNPAEGHWGAFQAALRYSYLDFNDEDINGGREDDVTVGLNWHLFPNARVMFNYVWGRVRGQGDVNGALTRFQIDF